MVVTLTTAAKNWLATNAGVSNCFSPTGVSYSDAEGVSRTGSTGDVVNAFFVGHLVGLDTAIIVAGTNYNGFKVINGGADVGFDDVNFAYTNDGTTPGTPAYCYISPANIVATSITPSVATCVAPCNLTVDITWTNNGGTSGTFTPTMTLDGTPVAMAPEALGAGLSTTKMFTVTGLAAGNHDVCANPNTLPCATIVVSAPPANATFTSTPSGASIYIDGGETPVGTTPTTVTALSAGLHTYRLTYVGCYSEPTGEFTTVAGSTVDVSVTFDTSARFESTPSGARIWIDGVNKGVDTPGVVTGITPGIHTYTLKKSGYTNAEGNFTAILCQRVNTPANLSRLQEAGMGPIIMGGLIVGALLFGKKEKEKRVVKEKEKR